MLIAGINAFIGFACGLKLTLLPFVVAMFFALSGVALVNFVVDASVLSAIGQLALASFCLQAGYVTGLLVRALAED
ncbi:MAG: hypothetical protein JWN07_1420 [Hyphomicrobiales bacterium]|nr:hypothetical protein [Hyphomicrobiales bacterium]